MNLEDSLEALQNNNRIVVGSPGTGKSMFVVVPNLLHLVGYEAEAWMKMRR